jgi:hypothetical protein
VIASKPDGEWPPLFHRVLQNRIRDWHRRRKVRRGLLARFDHGDGTATDPLERIADRASQPPDRLVAADAAAQRLVEAVGSLPQRQRQAFVLRIWEGLDAATCSRLARARHQALEMAPGRQHRIAWLGVGATAAAALVAAVWLHGEPPDATDAAWPTSVDFETIGEDLELVEELDFYRWLEDEAARSDDA